MKHPHEDHHHHHNKRLVIFVLAHPDDESMFFVPTIRGLQQQDDRDTKLWLFCLTTGNFDGLGKVRSKELFRTAKDILGFDKVRLCDDDDDDKIQDHPRRRWDIPYVARRIWQMIQEELLIQQQQQGNQASSFGSIQIITFDAVGVSGHVNHRDTFAACRYLLHHQNDLVGKTSTAGKQTQAPTRMLPLEMSTLVTDTTPLRYFPVLAWIYLLLTWCGLLSPSSCRRHVVASANNHGDAPSRIIYRLQCPSLNWRAMASHASQFVWYRRLFVVFSSYTYMNRLERQELATVSCPKKE